MKTQWRAQLRQDGHSPFYALKLSFRDPVLDRWFDAPEQRCLGSRYVRALLKSLGCNPALPELKVFGEPGSVAARDLALKVARAEVRKLKKGAA